MTVFELRALLAQYPEDLPVLVSSYGGGYGDILEARVFGDLNATKYSDQQPSLLLVRKKSPGDVLSEIVDERRKTD